MQFAPHDERLHIPESVFIWESCLVPRDNFEACSYGFETDLAINDTDGFGSTQS